MPFRLQDLRVERLNVEVNYHAAYTFLGLKGVLAERWAHGPVFGAFGESPGQINLTPPPGAGDEKLHAYAGIRASGLTAEGERAAQGKSLAHDWLADVYKALKPQRTVLVKVEVLGLHPVRAPVPTSERLRKKYYNEAALEHLQQPVQHAAVDLFTVEEKGQNRTTVLGVVGPPHRGYFSFADPTRDSKWWLGLRLIYVQQSEDGIPDPLGVLAGYLDRAWDDFSSVARKAFPELVG